jgi:hypothetical protein
MSPARLVAVAAFAVAAIFATQEVCLLLAVDPSSTDELVGAGVQPLNLLRARLMFYIFFLIIIVQAALFSRTRSFPALLGLIAGSIGCTVELAYRALELDGAFARWLPALLHAPDASARAIAHARLDTFYDLVIGAYRIIGVTAPATSLAFALANWGRPSRLQRLLAIFFLVNGARQSISFFVPLLPALSGLSGTLFIFTVLPVYVTAGLWMWREPALSPLQPTDRH